MSGVEGQQDRPLSSHLPNRDRVVFSRLYYEAHCLRMLTATKL